MNKILNNYKIRNIKKWNESDIFPRDYHIKDGKGNDEWLMTYPDTHIHFFVKNDNIHEGIFIKYE